MLRVHASTQNGRLCKGGGHRKFPCERSAMGRVPHSAKFPTCESGPWGTQRTKERVAKRAIEILRCAQDDSSEFSGTVKAAGFERNCDEHRLRLGYRC